MPKPLRLPFEVHDVALLALGLGTSFALLLANGGFTFALVEVAGVTLLLASLLLACRDQTGQSQQRIRYFASFAFILWFYLAVARITPALGSPLRDGTLLKLDASLFGDTPAIFCQRAAGARLTDLMSLCYLSYHVYLIAVVVQAGLAPDRSREILSRYLFTGFAVGFVGYLLVPAIGPARAFPELFAVPLPGGLISQLTDKLVTKGSSGYDVFPSLHVFITCILLDHDWRRARTRFWIMLLPSLGLMVSTIYLRFHYGIDVFAALLLFLVFRTTALKPERRELELTA